MGMRNNNSANLRTQATLLAMEYGDILRSNQAEVNAGTFNDPDGNGTAGFSTNSLGAVALTGTCSTSAGCTTTQMARDDLFVWTTNLRTFLPGGIATTAQAAGVFTVTINWVDDKSNADNAGGGGAVVAGAGVDVNGDGDDIDDIDTDGNGAINANENNFKQFATSFQP